MSVLKSLMVDTKSAWVEFPGLTGFEVEVVNLSRPELAKLRKRCTFKKVDRKFGPNPIEELNEDKFLQEFTKATVKNWRGFKISYLEDLLLVNIEDKDGDEEVPFSIEDAQELVANSGEFDRWLNDTVFDLQNFRTGGKGETLDEA